MDELARWFGEQLDADEREVRDRLCVNCGTRTASLRSDVGITGYTHEGDWQGRRCPGLLTGAEPVQRPERMLREIDTKRAILALHTQSLRDGGCQVCDVPGGRRLRPDACTTVRMLASAYADRPGYREEWRP